MDKIIGSETTYHGDEHPYLRGNRVRIGAVLKGAARENSGDHPYLTTDLDIEAAGGVTADDRVDVAPIIDGRVSFVTSDARAVDLACFAHLQ